MTNNNEKLNQKIVIALAADLNYAKQIMTLIKSICYHHQNVRFYLFNKEYPADWFYNLNKKLCRINCEIIDVKVITNIFDNTKILDRITSATFYRYFISDLPEERVLYLDCDIIVDGNLSDFYIQEFGEKLLVAVEDAYLNLEEVPHWYEEFPNMKPYFNSGVLLVNNTLWKRHNIKEALIKCSLEYSKLNFLDQDSLNIVLKDSWISEQKIYNYQMGAYRIFIIKGMYKALADFKCVEKPKIIHFTDVLKPWFNVRIDDKIYSKMREKYWFYYNLKWSEISKRHL